MSSELGKIYGAVNEIKIQMQKLETTQELQHEQTRQILKDVKEDIKETPPVMGHIKGLWAIICLFVIPVIIVLLSA
jgi:hypothetical protein